MANYRVFSCYSVTSPLTLLDPTKTHVLLWQVVESLESVAHYRKWFSEVGLDGYRPALLASASVSRMFSLQWTHLVSCFPHHEGLDVLKLIARTHFSVPQLLLVKHLLTSGRRITTTLEDKGPVLRSVGK